MNSQLLFPNRLITEALQGFVFHLDRGPIIARMKLENICPETKFKGAIIEKEIIRTMQSPNPSLVFWKRKMEYNYFYKFQKAEEILCDHIDVY